MIYLQRNWGHGTVNLNCHIMRLPTTQNIGYVTSASKLHTTLIARCESKVENHNLLENLTSFKQLYRAMTAMFPAVHNMTSLKSFNGEVYSKCTSKK